MLIPEWAMWAIIFAATALYWVGLYVLFKPRTNATSDAVPTPSILSVNQSGGNTAQTIHIHGDVHQYAGDIAIPRGSEDAVRAALEKARHALIEGAEHLKHSRHKEGYACSIGVVHMVEGSTQDIFPKTLKGVAYRLSAACLDALETDYEYAYSLAKRAREFIPDVDSKWIEIIAGNNWAKELAHSRQFEASLKVYREIIAIFTDKVRKSLEGMTTKPLNREIFSVSTRVAIQCGQMREALSYATTFFGLVPSDESASAVCQILTQLGKPHEAIAFRNAWIIRKATPPPKAPPE